MSTGGSIGKVLIDMIGKAIGKSGSSSGTGRRSQGTGPDAGSPEARSSGAASRIQVPTFGRSSSRPRPAESLGEGHPHSDPRRGEMTTADARPKISYAPVRDDDADPGEIVWAWVPYEEDPSQGKDRPLLVIGHIDDDVAALALTSRDHEDRHHHPLGSGPWDRQGRPSWIKLDRLFRLDPDGIRREGAVLDERRFHEVVKAWEGY